MKKIIIRESFAPHFFGFCFFLSIGLSLLIITFLFWNDIRNVVFISIFMACAIFSVSISLMFLVLCFSYKTIISEESISIFRLGKQKCLSREEILFIADVNVHWNRVYVVYPKGYDKTLIEKQLSIYLLPQKRLKVLNEDNKLLVFRKNNKVSQALINFSYNVAIIKE